MNTTSPKTNNKNALHRPLSLLGGISAAVFLRDYWQKKPLLIRNAIADFAAPLSKREVLTLARRIDAESRLITSDADQWQFEHGPFAARDFRQPKNTLWTVLIQDVQHFSHEAHELLANFSFIPQARIDDLMVSYAVPGAGVGAHFDSYDVFLLQGMGRRRWQISEQQDLRLKPGLPLKILSHFKPTHEFVLETGDMLYLPPHVAHNGIAETECMTWSIGCRGPSKQELSVAFLDYLRDAIQLSGQYADADLIATPHPARIDSEMRGRFASLLSGIQAAAQNEATIRRFIGCYLTEAKSHVVFDPPHAPLTLNMFSKLALRHGLELDLKTRMLYDSTDVFINGVPHSDLGRASGSFREFADQRLLRAASIAKLRSRSTLEMLYARYCEGALGIARH
jgi:50S ribosomal protein L16 3-hydroxylase